MDMVIEQISCCSWASLWSWKRVDHYSLYKSRTEYDHEPACIWYCVAFQRRRSRQSGPYLNSILFKKPGERGATVLCLEWMDTMLGVRDVRLKDDVTSEDTSSTPETAGIMFSEFLIIIFQIVPIPSLHPVRIPYTVDIRVLETYNERLYKGHALKRVSLGCHGHLLKLFLQLNILAHV